MLLWRDDLRHVMHAVEKVLTCGVLDYNVTFERILPNFKFLGLGIFSHSFCMYN